MKAFLMFLIVAVHCAALAHTWKASEAPVFDEAYRAHILKEWAEHQSERQSATPQYVASSGARPSAPAPAQAVPFVSFAPRVEVKWDDQFLYIESNGMPDHGMMVGITAWQQQVPLPQAYFGDNAWRLPLKPVPAKEPAMIKGRFLRGAIAIAVNGIPIFNPQNNRGEVSYEIGELDQWGGHCGRADDYHYHITPLHLQSQAGKGMPVAYALDGYPIYGLSEPDGSPVLNLDKCHGHELSGIGYHYHAATKYPYVIGGFHGEVVERDEQVDPQPRATPVRPSLQALRGAKITGFESTDKGSHKLSYEVNGDKRSVSYTIKPDGTYPFRFDNGREGVVEEVYTRGGGRGPGGPPPGGPDGRGKGKGKGQGGRGEETRRDQPPPRPDEQGEKSASRGGTAIEGIVDVNGDGVVTAQEFADSAKSAATKRGMGLAEALAKAREQFASLDHNRDGQLDRAEFEELTGVGPSAVAMNREGGDRQPQGEGERGRGPRRPGGGGKGGNEAFVERPDQPRSSDGKFMLTSPAMEDMTEMPVEYTGDGEAATLPLSWKGAPAGTQGYALIMDHAAPGGDMKWYWTLYDLPKELTGLPRNVKDVGKVGTGFKGEAGYEPPHSKGPGEKVYVITLYALSDKLVVAGTPGREELLAAMKGKVLASSSLRVMHTSSGAAPGGAGERPRPTAMNEPPPRRTNTPPPDFPSGPGGLRPLDNIFKPSGSMPQGAQVAQNTVQPPELPTAGAPGGERPRGPGGGEGKGKSKGKGGPPGLIKPSIDDTMKLNVYADNWFMLYVNGRLVAVDPIQFTPHNVVSVDFLPEYPMTIAVLAKDNADPKTGMEYGTNVGDGGFILKFADGTVTNANWKAKSFFRGPVNGDTANPKVIQEALPANWWAAGFDDSEWKNAKEYSVEEVDPKQPYFEHDFEGAKFIWTDDIALDNTIIFRTKVEKPGWKPRWNTKPDLDVTGAPVR